MISSNRRSPLLAVNVVVKISTPGNIFTFDTHRWSSILVTASIGISSLQKEAIIASVTQRADRALYAAKHSGKIVFIPRKHEIKYRKKFPEIVLSRAFFSELYRRDRLWRTR